MIIIHIAIKENMKGLFYSMKNHDHTNDDVIIKSMWDSEYDKIIKWLNSKLNGEFIDNLVKNKLGNNKFRVSYFFEYRKLFKIKKILNVSSLALWVSLTRANKTSWLLAEYSYCSQTTFLVIWRALMWNKIESQRYFGFVNFYRSKTNTKNNKAKSARTYLNK